MVKNFEDFLAYHFTNVEYHGPKDYAVDAFEGWIEKLSIDDFLRLADLYASEIHKEHLKHIKTVEKALGL